MSSDFLFFGFHNQKERNNKGSMILIAITINIGFRPAIALSVDINKLKPSLRAKKVKIVVIMAKTLRMLRLNFNQRLDLLLLIN